MPPKNTPQSSKKELASSNAGPDGSESDGNENGQKQDGGDGSSALPPCSCLRRGRFAALDDLGNPVHGLLSPWA